MQAWEERYFDRQEGLEEGKKEGIEIGKAEGLAIGLAKGQAEGQIQKLRELIEKKLAKGKTAEEIADALEESVETIHQLIKEIS